MCRAMGLPGEGSDDLYGAVVTLLDQVGIPRNLAALGVTGESAAGNARKAHGDAARVTNPVPATVGRIETLIRQAIHEAR